MFSLFHEALSFYCIQMKARIVLFIMMTCNSFATVANL